MKVVMLYRPNSATERLALDFVRDFTMQTGHELPMVDIDTPEGVDLTRLYDIVTYPAIIATADDGSLLQLWQGEPLPRISEVGYYGGGQ